MATRSRTTYKKRQKELARLEKQRDKAARRMQRRLEKHSLAGGEGPEPEAETEAEETGGDSAPPQSDVA